jgi:gamma-glutamyltranspeptidase/glutathione hydrolase
MTVTDRAGNVVEYTFTIEQTGGNGMVVPGYGFLLNNELTDFNLSSDGSSPRGANQVAGRKRPRSSIAPTIVLRDGRPLLAVGSPGGATIITTVLQTLINRLDLGMTLPQAIAAPRASQRNAATTDVEQAFIEQGPLAQSLIARGEKWAKPAEIGAATGIEFLGGGRVVSAAEPVRRGGGSAMVVRSG